MAATIQQLADHLAAGGVRHHLDIEEQAIRVVFVTRRYLSVRQEHLAILRLEVTDGGTICRATLPLAFAAGRDRAATCLALCEAVAEVPLARIEPDIATTGLHLVAELPVEDGSVTQRQLCALLDAVVEAAEAGQAAVDHTPAGRGREAA